MKFFYGPMSRNIVDTLIDFSNKYSTEVVLIPSRRQVDYNGGYVNSWTTEEFSKYVKTRAKYVLLERDHGGPGQGYLDDDGYTSLEVDAKYMDIIHIDPWKKYSNYDDGLKETIKMIEFCYERNKNLYFEVGTEEGIRPFNVEELEQFVYDLKNKLEEAIFSRIKYLVIQCGTKLLEKGNIGIFDSHKLRDMLNIAKKYNLEAKEHNGDWVSNEVIRIKESMGLKNINIAPEFGEVETRVLLNSIKNNDEDFEELFKLCYESNRWVKWVKPSFDPFKNKELLILICGHYIFSNNKFLKLKTRYENIDTNIKDSLLTIFMELNSFYSKRIECIFCSSKDLIEVYEKDLQTPLCYSMISEEVPYVFIPYNLQHCKNCFSFQTKYLGNINEVYKINHIDNFGSVKHSMHNAFSDFIVSNSSIKNIIEVGSSHDYLSRLIKEKIDTNYTIIDPSFTGDSNGLEIVSNYLETTDTSLIDANTILMSNVFEHFYNPLKILDILKQNKNLKYVYINHPDFDYAIENNIYVSLTIEHTFYFENDFIINLFNNYGFKLMKKENFENHTVMFGFERIEEYEMKELKNSLQGQNVFDYLNRLKEKVNTINSIISTNINKDYYFWPSSMHLVPLFINGVSTSNIKGLLDNSPNKIGKLFYGYNLTCYNFKTVIDSSDTNTSIFLGGSPNYRKELMLNNTNIQMYEI